VRWGSERAGRCWYWKVVIALGCLGIAKGYPQGVPEVLYIHAASFRSWV
jgi:hypothetical protein